MRQLLRLFMLLLLPTSVLAAAPQTIPSPVGLCDGAIYNAERVLRLPLHLLSAIAEVESGRPDANTGTLHPWPWTINAEGQGQFFATKAQAIAAVQALQARGVRSIDVGCMQVNLMHHPNAFATLDEAFEPMSNALYAAHFLNTLYTASGSWLQATAAYHSETPAIGAEYRNRVMARLGSPALAGYAQTRPGYADFAPAGHAYADFAPAYRRYGMFTTLQPVSARVAGR